MFWESVGVIKINLYELLQSKGWSQRQLSIKTDVREGTISDMCHNECKMLGVESLDKICRALNCDIGDILEYIPEK